MHNDSAPQHLCGFGSSPPATASVPGRVVYFHREREGIPGQKSLANSRFGVGLELTARRCCRRRAGERRCRRAPRGCSCSPATPRSTASRATYPSGAVEMFAINPPSGSLGSPADCLHMHPKRLESRFVFSVQSDAGAHRRSSAGN